MQLSDRVVLLTGASRGLGRALALALAARGARLACVARESEALDEVVREAQAGGATARGYPFDLAQVDDCESLVERVAADLGPVSVVLCNAATTTAGEVRDLSLAHYESDLRVNFLSAVALTRAALPGMLARGEGAFTYILSGAALRPLPAFSSYSATKAALLAFTGSLRVELAGEPVRVLTVFPGTLRTEFLERMTRVGSPRILAARRPADPARIAGVIVRALERDRSRVFVRGPAWLVHQLDHFAPGLVDRLLARQLRRS